MSILGRAVRGALSERRSATQGDGRTIPAPGSGGSFAAAGVAVSTESVMSQIAFFRGVQIIADAVSGLPLRAVKQNPDGTRKPLASKPLAISAPFAGLTLQEGISQIVTSLILRGNAYLAAVAFKDGYGAPTQWRVLSPDQVIVRWGRDGEREYLVNGKLWTAELVHLTGFMLPGAVKGAGILEYTRNALGLGLALDDVASSFFANGVMSSGVIGVDAPLTGDQAKATAEQFRQLHSGVKKAHLPIVIGNGAKYTPLSLTPEDAQFLQSRQFQAGQIATLLGIPPHMLGLVDKTTSWGTGIEVQGRAFVDYTLRGYIVRIAAVFTSWLSASVYAEFDTDAMTRATTEERFKNYQVALGQGGGIGFLNVDEVRALEGLAPLPESAGTTYFATTTMAATSPPAGPDDGATAPTAPAAPDDAERARAAAEVVQKVYLGVGPMLTADEARVLATRAGADLTGSLPEEPEPGAVADDDDQDAGDGDDEDQEG